MNFNLELFKQAFESDVKELNSFRNKVDSYLDSLDDDYIENVMNSQLPEFSKELGVPVNEDVINVFIKTFLIKYAYQQGLKDGKDQILLDKEKFDSSRNAYLEKKKHSKVVGKLTQHNKEV